MSLITIDQLLESVDLDFEPRWVTKDLFNGVRVWEKEPSETPQCWTCGGTSNFARYEYLKLSEFDGKDWTECIYEVPRKMKGKIEKIHIPELDEVAESAMYSKELAKQLNQVIDAVNEINENYACIAALTDIRKRLDTLEKCVKNKRGGEE